MSKVLRIAFNYDKSIHSIDTSLLDTTYKYALARNLYGRLVEYNPSSQLVVGVPESFSWKDNEVTFVFGTKVKTIDGMVITAKDAEVSLKRLILKGKSGHGDIRRFLCPNYSLKSLEDSCPGIRTENNKLILRVVDPTYLPMLLGTLESADYSIIPSAAIDHASTDYPIKDYRNTSGPYFVAEDSDTGAFVLKANPHHYHYDQDMPQELRFVPVDLLGGIEAMKRGDVDLLPTTQFFGGQEARKLLHDSSYNIHETMPLKVSIVRFSPKALKDFTPQQRIFAGLVIDRALSKILPSEGSSPTVQFFQALSDGTLTRDQEEKIQAMRALPRPKNYPRQIEFRVFSDFVEPMRQELKDYPEINVSVAKVSALSLPPEEWPDVFSVITDSAWNENLSLLGHNFQVGAFTLPGLNVEDWFADYLKTSDRTQRIEKLNKLHFDMLMQASFVPTEVTPYYAVARKPWQLNQSVYSAGTELWRMRIN